MKPYKITIDKIKVILNTAFDYAPDVSFEARCRLNLTKTHEPEDEFTTSKMLSYQSNYTFREYGKREGTIYIGLRRNDYTEVREGWKEICIEWNPNKTELPAALLEWLSYEDCKFMGVRSCDVAFDIAGIYPSDIRVFTRRNVSTYNHSTIYIDPGSVHGEIKIYDKTKERKRMKEEIPQTTRIEIRIRNPKFMDSPADNMNKFDLAYIQDICERLAEIYIPTDFHTLTYDLDEKYGKYDPATVYMLRQLSPEQQRHSLSLMSEKKAAKYRAVLKAGDIDRMDIDEYTLMATLSDMINRILLPLRRPPEKMRSWYDLKKQRGVHRDADADESES